MHITQQTGHIPATTGKTASTCGQGSFSEQVPPATPAERSRLHRGDAVRAGRRLLRPRL